jgi:hypothetical protein
LVVRILHFGLAYLRIEVSNKKFLERLCEADRWLR